MVDEIKAWTIDKKRVSPADSHAALWRVGRAQLVKPPQNPQEAHSIFRLFRKRTLFQDIKRPENQWNSIRQNNLILPHHISQGIDLRLLKDKPLLLPGEIRDFEQLEAELNSEVWWELAWLIKKKAQPYLIQLPVSDPETFALVAALKSFCSEDETSLSHQRKRQIHSIKHQLKEGQGAPLVLEKELMKERIDLLVHLADLVAEARAMIIEMSALEQSHPFLLPLKHEMELFLYLVGDEEKHAWDSRQIALLNFLQPLSIDLVTLGSFEDPFSKWTLALHNASREWERGHGRKQFRVIRENQDQFPKDFFECFSRWLKKLEIPLELIARLKLCYPII